VSDLRIRSYYTIMSSGAAVYSYNLLVFAFSSLDKPQQVKRHNVYNALYFSWLVAAGRDTCGESIDGPRFRCVSAGSLCRSRAAARCRERGEFLVNVVGGGSRSPGSDTRRLHCLSVMLPEPAQAPAGR
jgi:hypothetical protein